MRIMVMESADFWQRDHPASVSMGSVADRLLRLMVAMRNPVSDYSLDLLAMITKQKPHESVRLELTMDDEGWHTEVPDLVGV
jgi:hypothetical protein